MSGLTLDDLATAVATGFSAAGALVVPVVLARGQRGPYNPDTGRHDIAPALAWSGEGLLEAETPAPREPGIHPPARRQVLVRDLGVRPRAGDTLTLDARTHQVLAVEDVTAGAALLWRLVIR